MMTEEQISKLPKHRKDWLECFGNQWAPTKTAGVACLACVYGDRHGYGHSEECQSVLRLPSGYEKHLAGWKWAAIFGK